MRLILLLLLCCGAASSATGQVKQDPDFAARLEQAGLELLLPIDSDYRSLPVWRNDLQSYDFAIRSRREKLEMRYLIDTPP